MSRVDKFPANIATGQVSVATTAGGTLIAAANANRRCITITNHGTTAVYLGASGVATNTGALLAGVAGQEKVLCTTAAIYGIVGASTQTVSYVEEFD